MAMHWPSKMMTPTDVEKFNVLIGPRPPVRRMPRLLRPILRVIHVSLDLVSQLVSQFRHDRVDRDVQVEHTVRPEVHRHEIEPQLGDPLFVHHMPYEEGWRFFLGVNAWQLQSLGDVEATADPRLLPARRILQQFLVVHYCPEDVVDVVLIRGRFSA